MFFPALLFFFFLKHFWKVSIMVRAICWTKKLWKKVRNSTLRRTAICDGRNHWTHSFFFDATAEAREGHRFIGLTCHCPHPESIKIMLSPDIAPQRACCWATAERKWESKEQINTPNKQNINGKQMCNTIVYAEINRKLWSWPKSEDEFFPSFDSALNDQEVCFPFRFWIFGLD